MALEEILQQCQGLKTLHALLWRVWKTDYNRNRVNGGFIPTSFPFSEKNGIIHIRQYNINRISNKWVGFLP